MKQGMDEGFKQLLAAGAGCPDPFATLYQNCLLCPRQCGVDRTRGEMGFCRTPASAVVSSADLHFGEETPLVAGVGSGTIFFAGCNLRCVFCQNWTIAHRGEGRVVSVEELANIMIALETRGAANINLVTPTHVVPSIIATIACARKRGLQLPIVYNTSSYEETQTLALLAGTVDIYLADVKWMDAPQASRLAEGTPQDYPEKATQAVRAMLDQVGHLQLDHRGRAVRGLMLRHLVMPNNTAGTHEFVHWVAKTLSPNTYVNLMSQYRPAHQAYRYREINRRITSSEWTAALTWAQEAGLTRLADADR